MGLTASDQALVDEAMKKAGLVWLGLAGSGRMRAYWHAWVDGRLYLLTGEGEQPDPMWPERSAIDVLVRSKDNLHRLVVYRATATMLLGTDADWPEASAELAKKRLNLHAAESAPQRWARSRTTRCYRLTPTGEVLERPGNHPTESMRAAPVESPATTRGRLPWVLHKRDTRQRPLS